MSKKVSGGLHSILGKIAIKKAYEKYGDSVTVDQINEIFRLMFPKTDDYINKEPPSAQTMDELFEELRDYINNL